MSVEDVIEKTIGQFGRYQTWILFLISIGRQPSEFQLTNVVFILPRADYICLDVEANNRTNYCPCSNPLFDTTEIISSVTSEHSLICGRESLASLSQSMLQIGILPGSILFGFMSDRYGRKITVTIALLSTAVFGAVSATGEELWMFMVSRFFVGVGVGGTMLCCYVLLVEISGKSFRPYITVLNGLAYVIGYLLLPIIAYFVREWRHLQLVINVPWLLVILYIWLLPESPRWLITVGKKEEAIALLTRIAIRNNRPIEGINKMVNDVGIDSEEQRGSYLDLFRTPKVRMYTIINAFVWMFCSHTFFGINQYVGVLEGSLYLNVIISALILLPSLVYVLVGSLYLKRKTTVIISFVVAAVCLLLFIVIPSNNYTLNQAFAFIGQAGAYSAFVLIYLFAAEIFPTVVRNSAFGFASVFARFGSFLAPFVVNIGIEWVSILIFSGLAFCAAIMCYFLPETKDTVLLNTIKQTEKRKNIDSSDTP